MYIKKNIYKSHAKYSIEEKEKMVLMYLNGEMFHIWVLRYKMFHDATFSNNINFACNTKSFIQIIK